MQSCAGALATGPVRSSSSSAAPQNIAAVGVGAVFFGGLARFFSVIGLAALMAILKIIFYSPLRWIM